MNRKLSELIDIVVEVPQAYEIKSSALMTGKSYDFKWTAQKALMDALQTVTKGTIYENQVHDLIEKCKVIFDSKD